MVWGGIYIGARTELRVIEIGPLTAAQYTTDILEQIAGQCGPFIGDRFVFMHDNVNSHTADVVVEYLRQAEINALGWPARSPDINPIEHI